MSYKNVPRWIREIPDHLKTQKMCDEAVRIESYSLEVVPDRFKTEEMCNEAVRRGPSTLYYVPYHLKTQEMCGEAVRMDPRSLEFVPGHLKQKGYVTRLSATTHGHCGMSLISIRSKKCVIRQLRKTQGYWSMFLIG